jgi:hypothetical protein
MNLKRWNVLSLVLGLTVVAAACDDDDPIAPENPGPLTEVSLRVVHAAPDAPAVDVYAEGLDTPLLSDVEYGEVTEYLKVEEGTYNIQLRGAGASASSDPVYETGDLTVSDGDVITAIATGFFASMDDADKFRVLPLFEDFEPVAFGSARVRIVHAAPDAPTVAIDVGNDGSAEILALARFEDTGAAGVELPAGSELQIGIWTGNPLSRVTAFTTPALPDGGELFVIAIGTLEALPRETEGFSLLAAAPTGSVGQIRQNPLVYALHAGPDAPAVDIFVGDLEIVDDISFSELSDGIRVAPGSYRLDFFPHSAGAMRPGGAPAGSFDTPSLAGGQQYLAIATGFLSPEAGEQPFTLAAFVDDLTISETMAQIAAIHASPDAPAVDIGTVTSGTTVDQVVFEALEYPESKPSGGEMIPATSLTLGVAPTGDPNAIATFDVETVDGLRAFAVAAGALNPDAGEQAFRLLVVNTTTMPWTAATINPN